ncbi:MAG: RNA polymerase sigma factor [Candidatus Woesearchaeota archaeon]
MGSNLAEVVKGSADHARPDNVRPFPLTALSLEMLQQRFTREFYDKYQPALFRYLRYRTNRKEIAEDLTQEVFLQAWKSYSTGGYTDEGFAKTWLFTVAEHILFKHYRRSGNQRKILEDPKRHPKDNEVGPNASPPSYETRCLPDVTPEQYANDPAARKLVHKNLFNGKHELVEDCVKEIYLTPTMMSRAWDLSYQDISDILHVPLNTLKTRIHRGRKALDEIKLEFY